MQLTMLLSVVFIAMFGKSYIVYFLFLKYLLIVGYTITAGRLLRKHSYCGSSWDYYGYMLIANTVYRNIENKSMN